MTERRVEPWPWAIALSLAAMIGICLAFYAVAVVHPDSEVVGDAYAVGLRLNEELAARRESSSLGLDLRLVAREAPGAVDVRVEVLGAATATAGNVVVRRVRPAEGGLDADFALEPDGAAFRGRVPLPRAGRWRLVARAEVAGRRIERGFALWSGP
jgi:nitrogen fixation protein FixH